MTTMKRESEIANKENASKLLQEKNKLQADLMDERNKVKGISDKYNSVITEKDTLEKEKICLEQRVDTLTNKNRSINKLKEEAESGKKTFEAQTIKLKNEITLMEQRINTLQKENEEYKEKIDALESRIKEKQNNFSSLQQPCSQEGENEVDNQTQPDLKQAASTEFEPAQQSLEGTISNIMQEKQKLSFEYSFSKNVSSDCILEILSNNETIARQSINLNQRGKESFDSPILFNGEYTIKLTKDGETLTSPPFTVTDSENEFESKLFDDIIEISWNLSDDIYNKYCKGSSEGLIAQVYIDKTVNEVNIKEKSKKEQLIAPNDSKIYCKLCTPPPQSTVLVVKKCEGQQALI